MSMEDNCGLGAIVSFVLGWFLAQSSKLVGCFLRKGGRIGLKEALECYARSGGMPSGHTTSFVGTTIYFGWEYGFMSGIFALALCTTTIVVIDAINVRYAVGQQGKLLNRIARDSEKGYRKQKVVEGHTVPQVIAGTIIGVLIGTIVSYIM